METTAKSKSNGKQKKAHNSKSNGIEFEKIEGTPFTIYGEKNKYSLLMGKYRLTEIMSKDEVMKDSERTDWDRIIQIMMIVAEDTYINLKQK